MTKEKRWAVTAAPSAELATCAERPCDLRVSTAEIFDFETEDVVTLRTRQRKYVGMTRTVAITWQEALQVLGFRMNRKSRGMCHGFCSTLAHLLPQAMDRPDPRLVLDPGGMRRFDIERGSEVERTFGGCAAATAEPAILPGRPSAVLMSCVCRLSAPEALEASAKATVVIVEELHWDSLSKTRRLLRLGISADVLVDLASRSSVMLCGYGSG